jgi:hypothetical protein
MAKCPFGGDCGQLLGRGIEERAAGGGQHQTGHRTHLFADEALPDRRMLRIDWPQPGEWARQRVVGMGRCPRPG